MSTRKLLVGLAIAVPIGVFYALFWEFAVNVPFWDDFLELNEQFIGAFRQASGLAKLATLVRIDDGGHRRLYSRIWFLLVYAFARPVDFRVLMAIGNLSLLVILWLLSKHLRERRLSPACLIPVVLLLFTWQSHQNLFFASAALSNFGVIAFALLALWALTKRGTPFFVLAIGSGLLAALTLGNGILALGIGAVLLALQRDWKKFGLWVLAFLPLLIANRIQYQPPSYAPQLSDALGNPLGALVGALASLGSVFDLFQPIPDVQRAIEMYGYPFRFPTEALVAGTAMAGGLVFFAWTDFRRGGRRAFAENGFVWGLIAFAGLTAVAAALYRPYFGDLKYALASKYRIYSVLVLLGLYLLALGRLRSGDQQKWVLVLTGFAALLHVWAYARYLPNVKNHRATLWADAFNLREGGTTLFYPNPHVNMANGGMNDIIGKAEYAPPTRQIDTLAVRFAGTLTATPDFCAECLIPNRGLQLSGTLPESVGWRDDLYLWLEAESPHPARRYLIPTTPPWSASGPFKARVPAEVLPDSVPYRVGLLRVRYPVGQLIRTPFRLEPGGRSLQRITRVIESAP